LPQQRLIAVLLRIGGKWVLNIAIIGERREVARVALKILLPVGSASHFAG